MDWVFVALGLWFLESEGYGQCFGFTDGDIVSEDQLGRVSIEDASSLSKIGQRWQA